MKFINIFSLLIYIYNLTNCTSFPHNRYVKTFQDDSISQGQLNNIRGLTEIFTIMFHLMQITIKSEKQ